jgi:hypothetical protein
LIVEHGGAGTFHFALLGVFGSVLFGGEARVDAEQGLEEEEPARQGGVSRCFDGLVGGYRETGSGDWSTYIITHEHAKAALAC